MKELAQRKTRSDKGQVTFTTRDLAVLRWVAEQEAARCDQVQALLGRDAGSGAKVEGEVSESAARQVIARWRRAGWITQKKIFYEDPPWLFPTAHVLRPLDLSYKASEPSVTRLDHIFGLNEIRLAVEDVWPDAEWISERQLRADCTYTRGMSLPHLSDAKLMTSKGVIIIELELSSKHPATLLKILEELTDTYHTIWYFVDDRVRPTLAAALKKLDPVMAGSVCVFSYSPLDGLDESEGWATKE